MYHALIMAGGSGTRLWPLSRKDKPKQSLSLIEERTMFQVTATRLQPLIPLERVHVVTNALMAEIFQEQVPSIPKANYVVEPSAKDSGPAAALGLAHIHAIDPDATVAILTADHHIGKVDLFLQTLQAAQDVAGHGYIVTLGITPTFPATGFGYIERGAGLGQMWGLEVFTAQRFTEKPKLEVAQQWVADGAHSWNSGMFVLTTKVGLGEFAKQQPEFGTALFDLVPTVGENGYGDALQKAWAIAPKKSIDYAIMENAEKIAVIPVDIGWSDIGSWSSLMDVMSTDEAGNVVIGDHIGIDTSNSLIRGSGKLIATVGVKDLVVVDTPDAIFISPMERVQEVKAIVDKLKAQNRHDVL
jgi:mannose-1-phosphate guanylyltransferase/mannose-6-phosphate isomerase